MNVSQLRKGSTSSQLLKDRECVYNVTLRWVRATIFAGEKQWVLHNLSVYISAPVYNIFPHCLKNCTIFERKKGIENKMCISSFSTKFCVKHFS